MPPNAPTTEKALEIMHAAFEAGCNYWNAGEFYGTPDDNTLHLVRKYMELHPEAAGKVLLNVKGCAARDPGTRVPDGRPSNIRESADTCLAMLGPNVRLNQFEPARRDPEVPWPEQLAALKTLVDEGKIDHVSLSEVNANSIREAAALMPIASVETEFSLLTPDALHNGVAATCAEFGIPMLAYGPTSKGLLTGTITSPSDLPAGDFRGSHLPRFQAEALEHNLTLTRRVQAMAARRGCTAAQIAIGWIVTLSGRPGMPTIIPIPGTSKLERIAENSKVVKLTDEEMTEIEGMLGGFQTSGTRYPAPFMKYVNI